MEDRRRIPRVPVFFLLESLSRTADQARPEYQGVVKNITPDGLLLETSAPLAHHDLIQLAFTLPTTKRTLNLAARVRWCERRKVWSTAGLEFLDLTPEDRDAIMDYLVSLGPGA